MAVSLNQPRDPNTLSNYNNFITTHTTVNLDVSFENRQLIGNVVHRLKSITDAESKEIILDSSYLDISTVQVNGKPSRWELLPRFEPYGAALRITLENGVPINELVEVEVR